MLQLENHHGAGIMMHHDRDQSRQEISSTASPHRWFISYKGGYHLSLVLLCLLVTQIISKMVVMAETALL